MSKTEIGPTAIFTCGAKFLRAGDGGRPVILVTSERKEDWWRSTPETI